MQYQGYAESVTVEIKWKLLYSRLPFHLLVCTLCCPLPIYGRHFSILPQKGVLHATLPFTHPEAHKHAHSLFSLSFSIFLSVCLSFYMSVCLSLTLTLTLTHTHTYTYIERERQSLIYKKKDSSPLKLTQKVRIEFAR